MTKISEKTKETRKAIVLSGGSIRGAFQAGALNALLKNGYKPDIIQGISSGALNAMYVASEVGKSTDENRWEQAGEQLRKFWTNNIQKPQDLIRKRTLAEILLQVTLRNFKGLVSVNRLKKLLKTHIDVDAVKTCPSDLHIGAVNLLTGSIEYRSQVDEQILTHALASASMPIFFPPVASGGKLYYDGGIRDNAPLRHVIKEGANEIILILTQPHPMEPLKIGESLKPNRVRHLIDRTVEILLNDVLVDDLKELSRINRDLVLLDQCIQANPVNSLSRKRIIRFKVIRPNRYYQASIDKFDQADVYQMLTEGYSLGVQAIHRPFETGLTRSVNIPT